MGKTTAKRINNFYSHPSDGIIDLIHKYKLEGFTTDQAIELLKIDVEILKARIESEKLELLEKEV